MADIIGANLQIGNTGVTLQDRDKATLIQRLCDEVDKRWKGDDVALVKKFCLLYYTNVPPEDMLEREMSELYGAAISHWRFGSTFKSKKSYQVRALNPSVKKHGWNSQYTVVEAVVEDMPFLVDSIQMELNRLCGNTHLMIHPVLGVKRDKQGNVLDLAPCMLVKDKPGFQLEAWIHVEVDRAPTASEVSEAENNLSTILDDVGYAVADWKPLQKSLTSVINAKSRSDQFKNEQEQIEFLKWVNDHNFILMGYQYYSINNGKIKADDKKSLGILSAERGKLAERFGVSEYVSPWGATALTKLRLTKSDVRSTIHRSSYLDLIAIPHAIKGKAKGFHVYVGLYTSAAYNVNPNQIPWLREKSEWVINKASLVPNSHNGKALKNVLETYPRDELIQMDRSELYDHAMTILHLQERQRTRLLLRVDPDNRFVSCLVYVPRENYSTETRLKIQQVFEREFNMTHCEFSASLSEHVLARIYFVIHLRDGSCQIDKEMLERQIVAVSQSWFDVFKGSLANSVGEGKAAKLLRMYRNAFPAAYREYYTADKASLDVEIMERLTPDAPLAMHLYQQLEELNDNFQFKVYSLEQAIHLSDTLPILENMGVHVVDEHPYTVNPADGRNIWLHDFGLSYANADTDHVEALQASFQEAFNAIWNRHAENDGFNKLVVQARLDWRSISVLRAYYKYMKQLQLPYSQAYVEQTLLSHPELAKSFVSLFEYRFSPKKANKSKANAVIEKINGLLDQVTNLDQDRIIRRYLDLILATVRTNYYQAMEPSSAVDYTCFKINCANVSDMPAPRPMYEIFVYSPEFEGVHLRGGKVARGGLRWSDRIEDFRTEILGLVKAQMVKNAVIVPTGAKGGFVLKQPPATREEFMQKGVACYKKFITALLDITDNYEADKLIPPSNVVRHDDDDPYLVVAADKGTATFSDYANEISESKSFWLRDAFASGGSVGYDHKKMGITAKGAWESVKRHFREMGVDTQSQEFTVVGIGDMSGDVFGNGMLLSKHIKLVAAFNHMHIFVDPNPDAAKSYSERERLFNLSRSSWTDYDSKLISKGGGIFDRSAKTIKLTKEIKSLIESKEDVMTPDELIKHLLSSSVDLIWNGGIGTYVKASFQSHMDVGDKSNDALRVNASDLHCKVLGEGGNLGFTQEGRIEFALKGGRVNTDFIDNSAGVDCSDHEVNIKILLNKLVVEGDLTMKQRNKTLVDMTDEVSDLVLKDNYDQTRALSLNSAYAFEAVDLHRRQISHLEKTGVLVRDLESLPHDEDFASRVASGAGLSRPELCVLLAYSKMRLYDELLVSDVVDSKYVNDEVVDYFPKQLQKKYAKAISAHPLKREIIATRLANDIVNRVGASFVYKINEQTNAGVIAIVQAYIVVRDTFSLGDLWKQIDSLDNKITAETQTSMLKVIANLVERATLWILRNQPRPVDMEKIVSEYSAGVNEFTASIESLLTPNDLDRFKNSCEVWQEQKVPKPLAEKITTMGILFTALDVVAVSKMHKVNVVDVANVYYKVGDLFKLPMLHEKLDTIQFDNHWQGMAVTANFDTLYRSQREVCAEIFRLGGKLGIDEKIDQWVSQLASARERFDVLIDEISAGKCHAELAVFVVLGRELANIVSVSQTLTPE